MNISRCANAANHTAAVGAPLSCNKMARLHDDPSVIAERETIDYSKRITLEEAKSGNVTRPIRVYCDGIYDLFHIGHAEQLRQAKNAFPSVYLIVGVPTEADTLQYKGNTVNTMDERILSVRHCRYVDEVVRDAPWFATKEFCQEMKIDFVAHDDLPYPGVGTEDGYKWMKDAGLFLATKRTEGISTTDLITRVLKNYHTYVLRQLKRGCSPEELNLDDAFIEKYGVQ